MHTIVWEHQTKIYEVLFDDNFLGRGILIKSWKGKKNRNDKGNELHFVDNLEDAIKIIRETHQRRMAHGYKLKNPTWQKLFQLDPKKIQLGLKNSKLRYN